MSYETKIIDATLLVVNTENPRFKMVGNQREGISLMIENQKDKLVRLAQDIIENGINPSDLVITTPHQKLEGKFNVLEGNRRVIAIKLLNNPELIPEKYKNILNRFKKLSNEFKSNPINEIPCVVFQEEKEALRWIKLKHTGENEGIGIVTWDAQQKARFEERFEGKSRYSLQVIEFLKKNDKFDEEIKNQLSKVPISSLQRLLSDPDVRDVVGIDIEDGKIISRFPPDEIVKPLSKIIRDLLRDDFSVKEIYYKDDRANYIETFKDTELPNKTFKINIWEIITSTPPLIQEPIKQTAKRSRPLSTKRNTIIPKSRIVRINQPRINKIYRELKDLDLRDYVNAAAITFRVFVELSVDAYIEEKKLSISINSRLMNKVQRVSQHLKSNNFLTEYQLKPINTAISNPNSILSINTFNAYIHSRHFNPLPDDLKITWDNVEPFVTKIWELI